MMSRRALVGLGAVVLPLVALAEPADPVLETMQKELTRQVTALRKAPVPIYFLSYQLTDNRSLQVWASFGALSGSRETEARHLDVDCRVGAPTLDNTHPLRSGGFDGSGFADHNLQGMPIDGSPEALRVALWRETERSYRSAVQRLDKVNANVQVTVAPGDRSGDFSQAPVEVYSEPLATLAFDRHDWEQRLRRLTSVFAPHGDVIIEGSASVNAEVETRRYVNADGSRIVTSSTLYHLSLSAMAKAEDGMELPLHRTYLSLSPERLPDEDTLKRDLDAMVATLLALRKAPLAEPYTGPAVLSGRASAVFFHEIFGHRIEAQRQKDEEEAQTFKGDVNKPVLPAFLSVVSDPTLRAFGDTELAGWYRFDDEGVKASRVTVVDKGILRSFLLSRAPIAGFDHSNGHGRRQQGHRVVARQSNLIVESASPLTRAELKQRLIEATRAAGKPYGLLFDDIEGGFTFTKRVIPNAFNVRPTVVYRVRLDGEEELVRGVDLIGTPLTAFSKIVATDDRPGVFNGICGAESGYVPVSAVSPGLLVSQIEVQRKEKSSERTPLLPAPPSAREE
jgi:predicted Zn-dependent protease